jgi:tetratricopeptide (TPR) repeat protein
VRPVTPRLAMCLSLVLSLGPCTFAGETSDAITLQARQARDKGDIGAPQTLIRNARDEAGRTNAFDANLRLALIDAWLCEAAHDHQDDKLVKQASQDGVAAAERAVKLNPESSEAHRLAGELLGELIPHVFAGGIRYGARSTAEIEKAIQLDPQNPNAYVARGLDYYFTPKAFGGNKDKAIEMFKKAVATDPASDAAATAHIWLTKIYQSLGKTADASSEINEALKMNPDRLFARLAQEQSTSRLK